jgi:hypothetical protein
MLERAVGLRREHAVRDAAEVVERASLHRPDGPPVPFEQRPHRVGVRRVRQQDERREEAPDADDPRRKPDAVRTK